MRPAGLTPALTSMLLCFFLVGVCTHSTRHRVTTPCSLAVEPRVANDLVPSEDWAALPVTVQRNLAALAAMDPADRLPVAACWTGPVPQSVVTAFETLLWPEPEFQLQNRWTQTATNGSSSSAQGTPVTLTYSFVPDGTTIPSGVGEPVANSDLFAVFNAAFPSQATWQNRIHEMFARWSEVCGITYVFEPNDDGAQMSSASGALGVRGDVRIGGKYIDGSSGSNTLAYNSYPNNGDMVIDTSNSSYFANSTNNYRRFRNTLGHEAGHGIGLRHVCPDNNTKLMEPFITTAFDGPQLDDRLAAHRNYGDIHEPNDTAATAHVLMSGATGSQSVTEVSIDDNSDSDWYRIDVTGNANMTVSLAPVGATYLEGPQTTACNTGTSFNAQAVHDLGFEIRSGATGATVLRSVNAQPAGASEIVLSQPLIFGPGPYFIRVFGDATNNVQLYQLSVILTAATFPALTAPCADGNYPPNQSPQNLLFVNLSAGGAERRVNISSNASAIVLSFQQPALNPLPANYVLFGYLGTPSSGSVFSLPGYGDFCFPLCPFTVDPLSLSVIDSFSNLNNSCGANLLPSTGPLPLILPVPLPNIPAGLTLTLQGFFEQGGGYWGISNAVLIYFY